MQLIHMLFLLIRPNCLRLAPEVRPDCGSMPCKFLLLKDGTLLMGPWAFHDFMLARYENCHGQKVTVIGAGEVDMQGNVLSWFAPRIGIKTPFLLRRKMKRFLLKERQVAAIQRMYVETAEATIEAA